ncbi:MOSC domain-containing protein [Umezawaea beigongshangensis]|uniref:MOSC domain-containing protein n=1 Tax=Umezawaea beigongshangensis TaxID=2780383 RepID=UPI0018F12367|nr:MOSC N-terminal beta barrel domain-containing protein [Umezawaea beigongshangensis]
MTVRVHDLVAYPLKGCAGTSLDSAELTATGVAHDRELMLVEPGGEFLSQRKEPLMAALRPRLLDDGERLVVTAPRGGDLEHDLADGPRVPVSVHAWHGEGVDQGDAAAEWFSAALGRPCRLVRVPPEQRRESGGDTPGLVGFADAHAVLVTSLASLDGLNERIVARGGRPVPMNRFRPNVVLSGVAEPHGEDLAARLVVGGVELGRAKICVRCAVPMVDQDTGTRSGPEPIRTLATYRRGTGGGVTFGWKAAVVTGGRISRGDEVDVVGDRSA